MDEEVFLDPLKRGESVVELYEKMTSKVVGQDEALQVVTAAYQDIQAGMVEAGRPLASFMFLGPTGVGKTKVVETVAECLAGTRKAVLKINCGEFQHSHDVAKITGAPPGYLGHRESHPLLSQERLNQYITDKCKISLVLFDEIEKASDALRKLVLGILDKAELTTGDNKQVDFAKSMVFFTSNVGAEEIQKGARGFMGPGFNNGLEPSKLKNIASLAMKKRFEPEFVNRLDHVVTFHQLTRGDIDKIILLELEEVQKRIFGTRAPFILLPTDELRQHLAATGMDPQYGARHLRRVIRKLLIQPVSSMITSGQIFPGSKVEANWTGSDVTFKRLPAQLDQGEVTQLKNWLGMA